MQRYKTVEFLLNFRISNPLIENFLATVLLIHMSQSTRFIKRRTQPTFFEISIQ